MPSRTHILVGLASALVGAGVVWFFATRSHQSENAVAPAASPAPTTTAGPELPARRELGVRRVMLAVPPGGRRPEPVPGQELVGHETIALEFPPAIRAFEAWLERYRAASAAGRPGLESEGIGLAKARREAMRELIRANPQEAIFAAVPPAVREGLPEGVRAQLEEWVSGEGFYGVLSICDHDPGTGHAAACRIEYDAILGDRVYKASIYGARRERLTEESASLFGVALEGQLALHQDDFVIFDAAAFTSDPARAGGLAVLHRGKVTYVPDEAALVSLIPSLSLP